MLLSEYPDRRLPGDLSEAVARLEALAAAVSGDLTLARGVRRWWSWRLQRAADYVARQFISELGMNPGERPYPRLIDGPA